MGDEALKGRIVLITGAGSGIGRALAERAIAAGAEVTVVDRIADPLAELVSAGARSSHTMDVSDPDAWAKLPRRERSWHYVALNAGVMTAPPDAPPEESHFLTMDLARYRHVMAVNVDGVVHGVRRVLPELREGGAIVATASAAGLVGYAADVAYAMTKHAVIGLVRSVAGLLDGGRRICAICPGGVRTALVPASFRRFPMMDPEVIAAEIRDLWLAGRNGEVRVKMRQEVPAQRIAEPELPPWW